MTTDAAQLLRNAKLAIRENDVDKAWKLLHEYIIEESEDIEAWLMLGGLAKPENRLAYIERAEELAPDDERVRKALIWARRYAKTEVAQQQETARHAEVSPKETPPSKTVQSQSDESELPDYVSGGDPFNQTLRDQLYPEKKKAEKRKKPFKWLRTLITVVFLFVILFLLSIGLYSLITGFEPTIFGYQMMQVTSGTMEPTFMTGSLIIINTKAGQEFNVGDVVTFWTMEDPDEKVTSRIIDIYEQDGEQYFQTQGDNKNAPNHSPIRIEQILGKYTNIIVPYFGYLFNFIETWAGMVLLVGLLGVFLIVTQIIRVRKQKKKAARNSECNESME